LRKPTTHADAAWNHYPQEFKSHYFFNKQKEISTFVEQIYANSPNGKVPFHQGPFVILSSKHYFVLAYAPECQAWIKLDTTKLDSARRADGDPQAKLYEPVIYARTKQELVRHLQGKWTDDDPALTKHDALSFMIHDSSIDSPATT
jgi:hypothetical protein